MEPEAKLLVVVNLPGGAAEVTRFAEVDRPVQIGSAADCQIRIPQQHVFPVHAEILLSGWSLYVVDRSNGNLYDLTGPIARLELPYRQQVSVALRGTGVRLDLTSGIRDGGLSAQDKVRVVKPPPPQSRQVARPIEDLLPAEWGPGGRVDATLLTRGSREEFTFHDEIATTIGRTRACRIRVPDEVEGVSRTHARLSWHNGWLVLEDLGSTNGTWIDDHRIKRVVMRPSIHHHIEIGQPGASLSVLVVPVREETATRGTAVRAAPAGDVIQNSVDRGSVPVKPASSEDRLRSPGADAGDEARTAAGLVSQPRGERQLLDDLERRRIDAEAEWERQWRRIDEERRALQEERRLFEEQRGRAPCVNAENAGPMLTALVEVDDALQWLMELPEPDREVFRYLVTHVSVNEEEATRILGGPRQFRRFSLRFEAHLAHCPFRVRIETAGKVKCYVRED